MSLFPVPGLPQPLAAVLSAPRVDPPFTAEELAPVLDAALGPAPVPTDSRWIARTNERALLTGLLMAWLTTHTLSEALTRMQHVTLEGLYALPLDGREAEALLGLMIFRLQDLPPAVAGRLWTGLQDKLRENTLVWRLGT